MDQRTTSGSLTSSPTWEGLHLWLRNAIQTLIQEALEAEVTELLGRVRYQRRAAVDAPAGYRIGYGKPRKLTTPMGTVTLRRPRVRGLEERFESRILPLFARRTKEVSELLPELYLHGLAEGDFYLALRGLLGEEAPLSARTVARLKERWQAEWEAWRTRRLDGLRVVYLWVDGVYVKAGLERERAALLIAVAGLVDGRKEVVAVVPGYRESVESWSEVLRDLRERGMHAPRLVMGDGHLGIWGALRNVWPEADEQRCWNHKVLNVLEQLPRRQQAVAKSMLRAIAYAPTRPWDRPWHLRRTQVPAHGVPRHAELARDLPDRYPRALQLVKPLHLPTSQHVPGDTSRTSAGFGRCLGWGVGQFLVGDPGLAG